MKAKVLFFGATADSAGEREVEMQFDKGTLAGEALVRVLDSFPRLKRNHDRDALLLAVNQEYSSGTETIKEGDELAIFTAVSGG